LYCKFSKQTKANKKESANIKMAAAIQVESFVVGIIYFIVAFIGVIWLLLLKGLFKKQIFLQRKLFGFIILSCLTRGVLHAILNQLCGRNLRGQDENVDCARVIDRIYMSLDILASLFNFTIYLTLTAFWYVKRRRNATIDRCFSFVSMFDMIMPRDD